MQIFGGIYRTIELRLNTSIDNTTPHFSLCLNYAASPDSVKKMMSDDARVSAEFNIDPKCKSGMKDYYPKLFWSNSDGEMIIQSAELVNGVRASLTLLEYLSAVTKIIDKILDD